MLLTLCFVATLVAFFAALGRGSVPREERVPWTQWTARDVAANVVLGGRRLLQLDQRNPRSRRRRMYLRG